MTVKWLQGRAIWKVLTILTLAMLVVVAALPVASSHSCQHGGSDYGLCISQAASNDPQDVGSEPEDQWHTHGCESDDDACR